MFLVDGRLMTNGKCFEAVIKVAEPVDMLGRGRANQLKSSCCATNILWKDTILERERALQNAMLV